MLEKSILIGTHRHLRSAAKRLVWHASCFLEIIGNPRVVRGLLHGQRGLFKFWSWYCTWNKWLAILRNSKDAWRKSFILKPKQCSFCIHFCGRLSKAEENIKSMQVATLYQDMHSLLAAMTHFAKALKYYNCANQKAVLRASRSYDAQSIGMGQKSEWSWRTKLLLEPCLDDAWTIPNDPLNGVLEAESE